MRVNRLFTEGFRNLSAGGAEFSPGINLITGRNGQGKTNLLEAIYCASAGRSFRPARDGDLINHSRDDASIEVDYTADGRDKRVRIHLSRGGRRQIFINGIKKAPAEALSELYKTVLFCPDDLSVLKEGAAARRRMADHALCQLRPKYAGILSEYNRLCEQKGKILKNHREKPSLLDALPVYNQQLCLLGGHIIAYRNSYIKRLSALAAERQREISGRGERLTVDYKTLSNIRDPSLPSKELVALCTQHMQSHREHELQTGQCLSGPHRDDYIFSIDGRPAKSCGSQGQIRTAVISIKLAERDIFENEFGSPPVLLLDDVLSELDEARRDYVSGRIAGGQVIITCCGVSGQGWRAFTVADGKIESEE